MPDNSSHYKILSKKWVNKQKKAQSKLWAGHRETLNKLLYNPKQIALGSLSGLLLLTAPLAVSSLPAASSLVASQDQSFQNVDSRVFLISDLAKFLPKEVGKLDSTTEDQIAKTLSVKYGVKAVPELNGIRLNTSYGYIGAEQHLARYPGDAMPTHFDSKDDESLYWSSGMAPGLGAWGYFASPEGLTQVDTLREKYYIAVQTFLSPGYLDDPKKFNDFYKFRKMLVVNPNNGKAMVVVVGDAGPAEWTGKHLGGSPEVMSYLQRVDGGDKGPVLYFFVDDPYNQVPLGPINVL